MLDNAPSEEVKPKKTRSGSATRQKQRRIIFRVDEPLAAKIEMDAAAQGLSVGSYMRWLSDDNPARIRPTRRALPGEALLTQLKGGAGKVDGNLAQFLRMANRGEAVPVDEIADAARAVHDFYVYALETLKGVS
jgi:hypothetical protein